MHRCKQCGQQFKTNAGLSAHMRFKHTKEPAKANPSNSDDSEELGRLQRTVGALQLLAPKTFEVFKSVYDIVKHNS